MKRQIRFGVWETNSSSVNTLTIMSEKEYEDYMYKWNSDEYLWDDYNKEFVNVKDIKKYNSHRFFSNPCETPYNYFEKEIATYTTEHGDKVIAISIYGYEG